MENKGFISLATIVITAVIIVGSAVGIKLIDNKISELELIQESTQLGAFRPSAYTGKLLTRLAEAGSETTFDTTPNTAKDDSTLTTAKLGDFIVFTINPGAANEEKISVSAVSTSTGKATWTIINRGLSFTENAAVTANKKAHAIGEVVIISNDDHYMQQQFIEKGAAQHVTGVLTFDAGSMPKASSTPTYTSGNVLRLVTYQQLASTTIAGSVVATESVGGIGIFATQGELILGTATSVYSGTTYNMFPQNRYFSATPGSTSTVPVTETDGDLNAGWIGQDQDYDWSGTSTLSGTAKLTGTTQISGASTTVTGDIVFASTTEFNAQSSTTFSGDVSGVGGWLAADTADLTITNTTNVIYVATATVPAGDLETDNIIRGTVFLNTMDLGIATNTLRINLIYGGSVVASGTVIGPSGATTDLQQIELWLFANASTTSQEGLIKYTSTRVSDAMVSSIMAIGSSAVDSTSAQTLNVSLKWATENANTKYTRENYFIEIIRP